MAASTTAKDLGRIKDLVRTIPDFPKAGIMFRDVTSLFRDPWGLKTTVEELARPFEGTQVDRVVGIESRGFIVGAPVALALGCGLVLARKRGKLPGATAEVTYQLEYGTDTIQIHKDQIAPGERCLIVDDLLATGGTALATATLIEQLGGVVVGCAFIIDLPELKGRERLKKYGVHHLVAFEGH
jgi:adenine phosphoribosyltransferase